MKPEASSRTDTARDVIAAAREAVDAALDRWLPAADVEPKRLHEAMRYSALAPGKRIRPALCLAAGRAVGAEDLQLLPPACAVELIHAFSLIHDDLPAMDDDDLRRGRPTNHVVFGEAMAILAGDALSVLAFGLLVDEVDDPSRAVAMSRVLAREAGPAGMIGGQVLDMEGEERAPDLELVRQIHRRKTAALIRAACEMGAIAGGASDADRETLARYGELVGLAFQVQDDVLDETATAEELGKATGKDQDRGKQTYPAVVGLERARTLAAEMTQEAIASVRHLDADGALRGLAEFIVARAT